MSVHLSLRERCSAAPPANLSRAKFIELWLFFFSFFQRCAASSSPFCFSSSSKKTGEGECEVPPSFSRSAPQDAGSVGAPNPRSRNPAPGAEGTAPLRAAERGRPQSPEGAGHPAARASRGPAPPPPPPHRVSRLWGSARSARRRAGRRRQSAVGGR